MKTEQDWENYHKAIDMKKVKKIKRCNILSTVYMLCGIGCITLGTGMIRATAAFFGQLADAAGNLSSDDIFADQNILLLAVFGGLLLLCLFFFFRAMFRWDEAERISKSRYQWMPTEEEIDFINKRFDNSFVEYMLSAISPTKTRSVEVGFRSITVHSSRGKAACYYNKHGYEQLTNYGTKQLAYYLASKAFPEGFFIYQTKMVPAGSDLYVSGVTDVGGARPPKPKKLKRLKRMLLWLAVWLQDFLRLKTHFKIAEAEDRMAPVNDGQIVINKGYTPKAEGLKSL